MKTAVSVALSCVGIVIAVSIGVAINQAFIQV